MLIYDWYFKQAVTEEQMNDAFSAVQSSMFNLMTDQNLIGIAQGGVVTQDTPSPDLTVVVGGPFYAYDQLGQRIFTTGTGNNPGLDCSQDSSHVTTAVAGAGNEKWISIFILFERALSDPQIDGNGNTVFYVNAESFEYQIIQGAEAPIGTAARPALINPGLLVADLYRVFGQTTFTNADILQSSSTTISGKTGRTQYTFNIHGSPFSLSAGTLGQAISQMLAQLNSLDAADFTITAVTGSPYSIAGGTTVQAAISDLVGFDNTTWAALGYLAGLGAIVQMQNVIIDTQSSTSTSIVDMTGASVALTGAEAGDTVFAMFCQYGTISNNQQGQWYTAVVDGATTHQLLTGIGSLASTETVLDVPDYELAGSVGSGSDWQDIVSNFGVYGPVVNPGTITVKQQWAVTAGGTVATFGGNLIAFLLRFS